MKTAPIEMAASVVARAAAGRLEEHQIGRRAGLEAKKSLALTAARR